MSTEAVETVEERNARELAVLNPDAAVRLADGRTVEVRAFRARELRRYAAILSPFVARVPRDSQDTGDMIRFLWTLGDEMPELFWELLSVSTGLTEEQIGDLSLEEFEALEFTFWRVNTGFFAGLVHRHARTRKASEQPGEPSASG